MSPANATNFSGSFRVSVWFLLVFSEQQHGVVFSLSPKGRGNRTNPSQFPSMKNPTLIPKEPPRKPEKLVALDVPSRRVNRVAKTAVEDARPPGEVAIMRIAEVRRG
jgi:hypothetical protein